MSRSNKCLVLGEQGVGKTSFICSYIYGFCSAKHQLKKTPRNYKYTIPYPPPSHSLEIVEDSQVTHRDFSSVVLLYDPLVPATFEYALKLHKQAKLRAKFKFGCMLVACCKDKLDLEHHRSAARKLGVRFMTVNCKNRNSVKRCFSMCLAWTRKNLLWETRKPLLFCRNSLRLNLI